MLDVKTYRLLFTNYRFEDVNFSVEQGTLTGIVGPNGAGKSTLIKTLLGLHPALTGMIRFFGEPIQKVKKRIGYVPQRGSVDWDFPTNALDVVLMGLYGEIGWFQWPNKKHRKKAYEALEKMGMAEYAGRQISQLSGGQQQRFSPALVRMPICILWMNHWRGGCGNGAGDNGHFEGIERPGKDRPCRPSRFANGGRIFRPCIVFKPYRHRTRQDRGCIYKGKYNENIRRPYSMA